jgi:glycosyltransferase involved in cell wall biosynthesis
VSGSLDVSVLMPVHNGRPFVTEAARSVLRQRSVDVELIVVDDGSSDGSIEAIDEVIAGRIPLVVLRSHAPSGHPAAPRNQAAAAATAPWLALLDQDDRWEPTKLRRQLRRLRQTGAQVCYSRARVIGTGRRGTDYHRWCCTSVAGALPEGDLDAVLAIENVIPALTAVVDRGWWMRVDGVDPRRIGIDDYDLWLRLSQRGARFCAVQRATATYRWHGANLSASQRDHQQARLDEMWRELR